MPKFNKMYFPVDAIAKHEDFDVWYSDGERALRFEGPWEKESDRIAMIGRMGGQIGQIRPDNKALNYYLRHDRFEYEFQTRVIKEHYYVEGMLWDIHGSVSTRQSTSSKSRRRRTKSTFALRHLRTMANASKSPLATRRRCALPSRLRWPCASKRSTRA